MGLNAKERKFAAVYDGNGTKACKAAGYAGDDATLATQAWRLLRKADVRRAIQAREVEGLELPIASRKDRQSFWSEVMNDDTADLRERLKASELLGRSQADFTEKLEVKGELTLRDLVRESQGKAPEAKPDVQTPGQDGDA